MQGLTAMRGYRGFNVVGKGVLTTSLWLFLIMGSISIQDSRNDQRSVWRIFPVQLYEVINA